MAKNVVFTLTSGRSGTLYLSALLRQNSKNCTVIHESYLHLNNPNMFGLPIYDHFAQNLEEIRKLVKQKNAAIQKYPLPIYIETSHSFLKSYWDIAPEFFPQMKLVHLIRNPVEVAKSEANRETFINRWRLPFCYYRGRDHQRYFRWSLTGLEPIFESFDLAKLSLFQKYLIQWIEIENRAMAFLNRFNLHASCMTLHTPMDLKDTQTIIQLFHFLNIDAIVDEVKFPGIQNRTPGKPTLIGDEERQQCRKIIESIPACYLEIFRYEPYANCEWHELLKK